MLRRTSVVTAVLALSAATGVAVAAEPDSYYPTKGDGRIDVTSYALDLTWKPGTRTLVGTATLRVRPVEAADSMKLDLHPSLEVRRVTVDGLDVADSHTGKDLVVPHPLVPGTTPLTVVVTYAGKPRTVSAPTSRNDSTGLGWHTSGGGQVWTMQKPFGAYTWYPVNDHPSDRATYTLRLDVPDEWVGVSIGKLESRRTVGGRTVTEFSSEDTVAPHLVTVAIGPYRRYTETGPHGLPLTYWYPKGKQELLAPLKKTPDALAWLQRRLGPYPFARAGVVVTPGKSSVETQTLVTFAEDNYRQGSHDVQEQVAHNLAHAWYGAAVTPNDWRDVWMSESMATYLQAKYAVSRGWDTWRHWEREFTRNDSYWREIFGPPGAYHNDEFGQRNVHYGGALILERLKDKIGAAAFDEAMRRWPQENLHTTRGRGAYISFLESVSGQTNLNSWFGDWLTNERTPAS